MKADAPHSRRTLLVILAIGVFFSAIDYFFGPFLVLPVIAAYAAMLYTVTAHKIRP